MQQGLAGLDISNGLRSQRPPVTAGGSAGQQLPPGGQSCYPGGKEAASPPTGQLPRGPTCPVATLTEQRLPGRPAVQLRQKPELTAQGTQRRPPGKPEDRSGRGQRSGEPGTASLSRSTGSCSSGCSRALGVPWYSRNLQHKAGGASAVPLASVSLLNVSALLGRRAWGPDPHTTQSFPSAARPQPCRTQTLGEHQPPRAQHPQHAQRCPGAPETWVPGSNPREMTSRSQERQRRSCPHSCLSGAVGPCPGCFWPPGTSVMPTDTLAVTVGETLPAPSAWRPRTLPGCPTLVGQPPQPTLSSPKCQGAKLGGRGQSDHGPSAVLMAVKQRQPRGTITGTRQVPTRVGLPSAADHRQLGQPGETPGKPVDEGRGGGQRRAPFVLGRSRGGFGLVAEDPKNSEPTRQSLEGPIPFPASGNHFHHRHDVRVVQGRVKIQGLQNRNGKLGERPDATNGRAGHRDAAVPLAIATETPHTAGRSTTKDNGPRKVTSSGSRPLTPSA